MNSIKKHANRFKLISSSFDAHNFQPSYTFLDLLDGDKFTLLLPEHSLIDEIIDNELTNKISVKRQSAINKLLK